MNRQLFKVYQSRLLGNIDTAANGKQTAHDTQVRIVGYYDPRMDKTIDAQARIIGADNLLASLI